MSTIKPSDSFTIAVQAYRLEAQVAKTGMTEKGQKETPERLKLQKTHYILAQKLENYAKQNPIGDLYSNAALSKHRFIYQAMTDGQARTDSHLPLFAIDENNFPKALTRLQILASSGNKEQVEQAKRLLTNMRASLSVWKSDAGWVAANKNTILVWEAEMAIIEDAFLNEHPLVPEPVERNQRSLLGTVAVVGVAVSAIYLAYAHFFSNANQNA